VPAHRNRCEGREAFPFDHRAASRHARRDHTWPATDRGSGPLPARGQSGKPLCPRCLAAALYADRARQSLTRFEQMTGLKLMDANGIKDDLPPITTFLNRLLA